MRELTEDAVIKRGESLALYFKAFVRDYFQKDIDPQYYLVQIISTNEESFFTQEI
jgi:hypothetical protein